MNRKALIVSIKGTKLSHKEKILLSKEKPWGIILFNRNLKSIKQINNLTDNIKKITKNSKFPILIDEEGCRVSRLKNIIDHNFSANLFGDIYKKDKNFCLKIYKYYLTSLCKLLKSLGININTIPVLDILKNNTNKIIGNRSFSKDKKIVKELGKYTISILNKNKIGSVIKHIPGHGSTSSDSHKVLPKITLNRKIINKFDFYPFKETKSRFGMTAHIRYNSLDKKNVATFSKKIINEIIRKKIGFKGILISDDISMKALKYDLITNAKKSLEAGCNLVLYCSGNINDNFKLIKSIPYVDKFTAKKTSEFFKYLM